MKAEEKTEVINNQWEMIDINKHIFQSKNAEWAHYAIENGIITREQFATRLKVQPRMSITHLSLIEFWRGVFGYEEA